MSDARRESARLLTSTALIVTGVVTTLLWGVYVLAGPGLGGYGPNAGTKLLTWVIVPPTLASLLLLGGGGAPPASHHDRRILNEVQVTGDP